MKDIKPQVYNEIKKNPKIIKLFINNFLNLKENKKLSKYQNLIKIFNSLDSVEFNELLLFFLEELCQSYFNSILNKYNNKYSEKCCEELLLNLSIEYFKKAILYLYENKNNNDNKLLKLYSIAYIKTYCYYYVEINYYHFDKCNFKEINNLLIDKDPNNEKIRNIRNIYIWKLYYTKFENFEQFIKFDFSNRNIPIERELREKLKEEGQNNYAGYIFKESFVSEKWINYYKTILTKIENYLNKGNKLQLNFKDINNNFDAFYCLLVNKLLSYIYTNEKNIIIKLKYIYQLSSDKINLCSEGKILYKYLLNEDLFHNDIVKKISDRPLSQEDFEIL